MHEGEGGGRREEQGARVSKVASTTLRYLQLLLAVIIFSVNINCYPLFILFYFYDLGNLLLFLSLTSESFLQTLCFFFTD